MRWFKKVKTPLEAQSIDNLKKLLAKETKKLKRYEEAYKNLEAARTLNSLINDLTETYRVAHPEEFSRWAKFEDYNILRAYLDATIYDENYLEGGLLDPNMTLALKNLEVDVKTLRKNVARIQKLLATRQA